MSRSFIITLFLIVIFLLGCLNLYLFVVGLNNYFIVFLSVFFVLLLSLIIYIKNTRSDKAIYNSTLRNILRVYDSVLVEVVEIPDINSRQIIRVMEMDELFDAQSEIRKPIYYKIEDGVCSFVLFDLNIACVYILRESDQFVSALDYELNNRIEILI